METFKEQEARAEEVVTPDTPISSSPDETVMPPPPSMADDFRQFQDLIRRVADILQILLEEVKDPQNKLPDTLQLATPSRVNLPVNEAFLDLTKVVWQMPAIIPQCAY